MCVLQVEVISELKLADYRQVRSAMDLHVMLVRLDEELRLKKSGLERIEAAESLSWNFSFSLLICDNLSLNVYLLTKIWMIKLCMRIN